MKILFSLVIAYVIHDAVKIPLTAVADEVKTLLAFDFDRTVVSVDSDQMIVKKLLDTPRRPFEYNKDLHGPTWLHYMQVLFRYMHGKGFRKDDYTSLVGTVPFTQGMEELIREAGKSKNHEIIIISDGNSFFVNAILEHHGLLKYVKEVFTNPAYFDETGLLVVGPYHDQTNCGFSNRNLCKARVLNEYVAKRWQEERVHFNPIYFIGDGGNDYCPAVSSLKNTDFVFAKRGEKLAKKLEEELQERPHNVPCTVMYWSNGTEIANHLRMQSNPTGETSG